MDLNKTHCHLYPDYAFRDFDNFAWCFYSWANATDDTSATVPFNSTFGHVIYNCFLEYCFITTGCTATSTCSEILSLFDFKYGRTSISNHMLVVRIMGCLAMLTQTLQDRSVLFIPLSFALLLTGGRLWYYILCRLALLYIYLAGRTDSRLFPRHMDS